MPIPTSSRGGAFALCACLLLLAATTRADTVVFGSFNDEEHADEFAREVSRVLAIETRLLPVTENGTDSLRLIGPAGLSPAAARTLAERARANGFESVWIAPDPEPDAQAETPTVSAGTPAAAPGTAPDRLLLTTATSISEDQPIAVPRYDEKAIDFVLDGRLDERVWAEVPGYDSMRVVIPDTLAVPRHRTLIRYFYTERGLYVSMWGEQPPDTLMARLSKRDDFFSRDSVSITLDTSGDGIYGYWFSVALGDSLSDGKVAPERQYSREWDGPWDGRSAATEDGWSAELFLPWSMMAMPGTDGERRIGLYVSRQVGYLDERFGYPALPETGARFMSALQPVTFADVTPKRQLDVYPYVSGDYDFIDDEADSNVGVDVFWRPSTNLQMSGTVNPDFGAVESDDVVINLTATETYFPEKRLFFLEGNEIFETTPRSRPNRGGGGGTGSRRTTQLFPPEPTQIVNTRRIGGAPTVELPPGISVPDVDLSAPSDLIGALKATGQIGGFRYGAMGAVEDDMTLPGTDLLGDPVDVETVGRDFGVARFLYEHVGAGRQSVGYIGTYVKNEYYDAVVHGVDAHYLNSTGKLQLDLQLLASDVASETGYGAMLDAQYTQRQGMLHTLTLDAADDKLDINDLGFLRRNDNYGGAYSFSYTRSKGMKRLRNYNLNILTSYWENGDGEVTRFGAFLRNTFTFNNLFELRTEVNYFPKRWDDLESEGFGSYRVDDRWVFDAAFGTDATRILSFSGRLGAMQEQLSGWTYQGGFGFTYKPNQRFSLDLDLNYADRHGWLLNWAGPAFNTYDAADFQPRMAVDLFLSARQQFRMTLQWAAIKAREQTRYLLPPDGDGNLVPVDTDPDGARDFVIDRMTVQLRYRWQIAPLSDLFLVYTRGSNVPDEDVDDSFDRLFNDALTEPVIDFFTIKLRYRFGL